MGKEYRRKEGKYKSMEERQTGRANEKNGKELRKKVRT
jgi:hypothetical protein